MSAYTPGPYRAALGVDGRHGAVPILTEAPAFKLDGLEPYHPLIAQVLFGRGHADKATAEATAKLFAAAPELASVMQMVLDHVENPDLERVNGQCTLCFSYRNLIRETLAKTGVALTTSTRRE